MKNINADNINLYSRWLVLQCPFLAGFAVPGDTSSPIVWLDPSGLYEMTVSGGYGSYIGLGWSADVAIKETKKKCCKNGRSIYGDLKLEVAGTGHAGIGLGGHVDVLGFTAQLEWKGPGVKAVVSGTCTNEKCGDPYKCCKACVSVGLTSGNDLGVGAGPVRGSVRIEVEGNIKACYNFGGCPKKGWAVGWCGSIDVDFSWRLLYWGDTYSLVGQNGCIPIIGDESMF